ncbi:MAG TPA: hypothetical protein VGO11_26835 [Chthoniobacteraceae bacterium]|jgi:hypothetical protein|nr:hypothetical protein [Chthoniobacteraceae bacterium]
MPFDPSFPATDALLISSEFRAQFTGLFDLIQAVPVTSNYVVDEVITGSAGGNASVGVTFVSPTVHFTFTIPRGADGGTGPEGAPFTNFVVDGVFTLNPGESATVGAIFDGTAVRMTFAIPRGAVGDTGAVGPAFTSFVADPVTTLPAGSDATVGATFDGTSVHLAFGIPRGADGGVGPAGEVTTAQLNTAVSDAIAGTAQNPTGVADLGLTISDPPTQAEMQTVSNKVDELLGVLRRM